MPSDDAKLKSKAFEEVVDKSDEEESKQRFEEYDAEEDYS